MERKVEQVIFNHGLTFYATAAFLAAFFGARIFATLNPRVVVVREGIHFHHFWYGLTMVTAAGWLGITLRNERLDRNLALIFGLGAGLVGDEIGLLLTFGDYTSNLTLLFLVGAVGFIVLSTLLVRFRNQLEKDVFGVNRNERLLHVGLVLAASSSIFFAFGSSNIGLFLLSLGILIFLLGFYLERRRSEPVDYRIGVKAFSAKTHRSPYRSVGTR